MENLSDKNVLFDTLDGGYNDNSNGGVEFYERSILFRLSLLEVCGALLKLFSFKLILSLTITLDRE